MYQNTERNYILSFYSLLCYCFIVDFVRKMSKQEGVTAKLETAKLSPTTVKYDLISTRICHCPLILNMSSLPLPKIETLVIAVHQYRRMLLYTRCVTDHSQSLVFFSQAHILNAVPLLNEISPFHIAHTETKVRTSHLEEIFPEYFLWIHGVQTNHPRNSCRNGTTKTTTTHKILPLENCQSLLGKRQ